MRPTRETELARQAENALRQAKAYLYQAALFAPNDPDVTKAIDACGLPLLEAEMALHAWLGREARR